MNPYSTATRARMSEAQKVRSAWTPGKVELLRAFVVLGQTAQEIGDALGFSKNAVIGKCSRLGIRLRGGRGRR